MQKFTFLLVLCFLQISLFAQVRLDVEGDAKLVGKMELIKAIGDSSLYIGANAGMNDTPPLSSSNRNTFIGTNAGAANTNGEENAFLGNAAGYKNVTGSYNSFFGSTTGRANTTGSRNSFFGSAAGRANTTGFANSFFGEEAGLYNTTGFINSFFGVDAGKDNTTGSGNSFFGKGAGEANTEGFSNSFVGADAGRDNTFGAYNSFIGNDAGIDNTTGNYNTFIGNESGNLSGTVLDRTIAIGYQAKVNCTNCAVIGGTGTNAVNVGIGTSTPTEKLDIVSNGDLSIKATAGDEFYSSLKLFAEGFNPLAPDNGFELLYDDEYQEFKLFRRDLDDGSGEVVVWTSDGNMEVRGAMEVDGNFYVDEDAEVRGDLDVNGTFINSDKRFKKQIKRIDSPLTRLHRVNGVSYAFKNQEFAARNFTKRRTLGLIAQEVEKVFPMLVKEDEEGYKAVNYDGLIPVLIEATKEQQQLIDLQKETLTTQSQQLADQQQQINELKGVVDKLLAARTAPQKTNNYTLPLLQKARLGQNQPNPFNETTLIDYYLPENVQTASIQVTSLSGQVLGAVQILEKGQGQVNIQAQTYPTGTYNYSLIVDGRVVETKKMVLIQR